MKKIPGPDRRKLLYKELRIPLIKFIKKNGKTDRALADLLGVLSFISYQLSGHKQ